VLVSGEGALIPAGRVLGELLGIATGPRESVGRLSANRSNVSDEQLRAMEPVLAVAFGLALEDE
jgi:type IV pilus assembly protein PilM